MTEKCETSPFLLLNEAEIFNLLPLLKKRFPRNLQVYNICLMYPKFTDVTRIYALNPNWLNFNQSIDDDTWIICVATREDAGVEINISNPENSILTEQLKEIFLNAAIIDWKENHWICGIDRSISAMFLEIELMLGNHIAVHPCNLFYYDPLDALNIKPSIDSSFIMKSLNNLEGIDFIFKTWKYSTSQSFPYMKRIIERNPSSGIYLPNNTKPVAGITFSQAGVMSMLYVDRELRGQNFGKLCMEKLILDLANKGFIPCSSVEMGNTVSSRFHMKLGMKTEHIFDFILFTKSNF